MRFLNFSNKVTKICCSLCLGLVVAGGAFLKGVPDSTAQEVIQFPSAPIPISPFKLKKAKAKGIRLAPAPGIELTGHLFRPKGNQPHPAIIVLVSGDGLQPSHLNWGKAFSDWGYVALVIDSFGSRGGTDSRDTPSVGMPADAVNAARFLKSQDFVDGDQMALLGFSMGGSRLFSILGKSGGNRSKEGLFKAGVAFYPNCSQGKQLQTPFLVLGGDQDDLMAFSSCKTLSREATTLKNDITFVVYAGATHFFDNPNYRKDVISIKNLATPPLHFEKNHYDPDAHEDAKIRVHDFLEKHLKGTRD